MAKKKKSKRKVLLLVLGGAAAFTLYFFGPTIIIDIYDRATSPAAVTEMKERYQTLSDEEASLPVAAREESAVRRKNINDWLRARGYDMDPGGAEEQGAFEHAGQRWGDIWRYWRSPKEERDTEFLRSDLLTQTAPPRE